MKAIVYQNYGSPDILACEEVGKPSPATPVPLMYDSIDDATMLAVMSHEQILVEQQRGA